MGEVINKATGILTQSVANAAFDEIQLSEFEKTDKAIKIVKKALDKAHTGTIAIVEAKPFHRVLEHFNREKAIELIHKCVKKYKKFINGTTPITGRYVVYEKDYYADKADEFIKNDVKFSIFVIYFAAVTEEGVKIAITKALKPIFGVVKDVLQNNCKGEHDANKH